MTERERPAAMRFFGAGHAARLCLQPNPRARARRGGPVSSEDAVEKEEREASGVTRNANVVLELPHDWGSIETFLRPALDRLDAGSSETQLVVVTPDPETANAVAEAAARLGGMPVVPATTARRAARRIKAGPVSAIAGAPAELAELVSGATLKLADVRVLLIAWADELLAADDTAALEAVMAEIPKDAARTLVAASVDEKVEAFVERYMRRARRMSGVAAEDLEGDAPAVQYVSVAPSARPAALRRLLDDLDPPSAAVVVRTPASAEDARRTLHALGYGEGDAQVRVVEGDVAPEAALVILYDVPASRAELRRAASAGATAIVALASPRGLAHLRGVASAVTPLALSGPVSRARAREEALRRDLRAMLERGGMSRDLLVVEPLLGEWDGAEIAAAALALLQQERERASQLSSVSVVRGTGSTRAPAPAAGSAPFARLFVSVGDRDGIRPGDLVGAITGEAGITSDNIGKIELRDTHSIVEVATPLAATVAEKITGVSIKGRRIQARVDTEQGGRSAPRGDRPERGGDRGDRGARRPPSRGDRPDRGDRGDRGDRPPRGRPAGARGERPSGGRAGGSRPAGGRAAGGRTGGPPRGDRPDRGERGDRGDRGDRGPRTGRMAGPRVGRDGLPAGDDWAERAERMKRSKRTVRGSSDAGGEEAGGE